MKHQSLHKVCEGSIYPKYICSICGEKLWTMTSKTTHWQEWLYTKDNKRHYKNKCNFRKDKL